MLSNDFACQDVFWYNIYYDQILLWCTLAMTDQPDYLELNQRLEELKQQALENESVLDSLFPIFNYSLDLIGSGNLQGYFTKVNPSFTQLLGYPEEAFLQAPFLDFVHDKDFEATRQALENAGNGQKEIYIANRYRCQDGSFKWIDWRVQVLAEKNLFIAVGRDITAHKILEEELYLSERRYRNIIQTSNDGFIQTDESGKITDCNSAYLRMSGYTRDELLVMHITDLKAVESAPETFQRIKEMIKSGSDCFETTHKRKDSTFFDVEVSTTFIAEENIFVAFIKDITERKRSLEIIRESEQRFRQLAVNIPEVFWLGSLDWQEVYYISPAYERIWGKKCEDLYANPLAWLESVHADDRRKVEMAIPKAIGDSVQSIVFPEYRIVTGEGHIRWIRARAFPIRNAENKLYRIAGIAEDVTESKTVALENEKLVAELKLALAEVKALSGLLPICSSCKKIRNDTGYWEQIESYIMEHSEAEFSHSICPDCATQLYPDFFDENGEFLSKKHRS